MQQHMFIQLEQCMQQAYSGLLLGTPIRTNEYAEQFKKSNNTILLTESKCIEITPYKCDWNNESDPPMCSGTSPLPPLLSLDNNTTTPKTASQLDDAFGGVWRKTGFPLGLTRPVISGHPAGSENGEFEDYFNPRIYTNHTLYTTSPSFAAAVNLRVRPISPHSQVQYNQIQTIRRQQWDRHPYGRNTCFQEALQRCAEKKVAKHFPDYRLGTVREARMQEIPLHTVFQNK